MRKKWMALFLSCALTLSLCACGEDTGEEETQTASAASGEEGAWSVYWYLCGSSLGINRHIYPCRFPERWSMTS